MHLSGDDPAEPKLDMLIISSSRQAEEPSCPETSSPTSSFISERTIFFSRAQHPPPPHTHQADHPLLSCTASCWPDLSPPTATRYEIPLPSFFLPFSVFFVALPPPVSNNQRPHPDDRQPTDQRSISELAGFQKISP
ncbi:hypothetical protein RDI58_003143 [Solanum bulbocastanum]|uniref:Uncharacterized protein n=1 Tax=Solanum bulbocastanum TaxID=147425 RepID=A0AAN8UAR2_SOLBU